MEAEVAPVPVDELAGRPSSRATRIALITDADPVSGHLQAFVTWLRACPGTELVETGRAAAPRASRDGGLVGFAARLDRRRLHAHPVHARHLERRSLDSTNGRATVAIERLGQLDIDFAVVLSGSDGCLELARQCAEGVVHIDPDPHAIDHAALAAIDERRGFVPFEIGLVAPNGERRALVHGSLAANRSVGQTGSAALCRILDLLRRLINDRLRQGRWPAQACDAADPRLDVGRPTPASEHLERFERPEPIETAPLVALRHLSRRVLGSVQTRIERLAGADEIWQVGVVRQHWRDADAGRHLRVEGPGDSFLADPFVIERDGQTFLFAEAIDPRTQRGYIVAYGLPECGPARFLGTALAEGFHLSFPFPFEFEGRLYMCPETHERGQIRVYVCTGFPLQWQLHTVLMDSVSAVDTMLFPRDGRWWMLTNLDACGTGDLCSELHLFHAASPLSREWTAHPMNPLIIDPRRARNAGLVRDGARLYRVSQRQGFERYGESVAIHEIEQLDTRRYRERTIRHIEPGIVDGATGTHHLHSTGRITVFDYRLRRRDKRH